MTPRELAKLPVCNGLCDPNGIDTASQHSYRFELVLGGWSAKPYLAGLWKVSPYQDLAS